MRAYEKTLAFDREVACTIRTTHVGERHGMTYYAKRANKPHEIVPLIGIPDSQEPYVNPTYPGVPTGAFVEHWNCGCSATPNGFGSVSLMWAQCVAHRDIDVN